MRPLSDLDYAALAAFRQDIRNFLGFSERAAAAAGITSQQYQTLLAIRAAPGGQLSVGDIASSMLLQPHSASGLLNRLEAGGMIERTRARDDRRRIEIRLADRGRQLLLTLASEHREELKRLRPMLEELTSRLG
ncbi:MarR family transcriptional regulator [Sphingomonas sp. S1-29]|uniref:MarR family transcriptional regulator n=1 Tax=Sphingomonas sp. S1-29 TaxID=2991074 RepID=UPI0022407CD4|nr:helix-turn-helix domain-containing protein [Sphingomonas sp. S1-29]UZK71099.1 MarR family transcriptional regulator [Sphingomonas sp. S1-29]